MGGTVEIPVWLLWVGGILACIAALDRIIGPGIRWVLRRRMERLVARLNTRLQRPIEPFRLARRKDTIVRLLYDPRVLEAVAEHATETGLPPQVAFAQAETYAREIVPGFSATLYFGIAARGARFVTRLLYRVRIGRIDEALAHIDPRATVIFVMNHRSNMDYVLVTWLVSARTTLSYAVGEWARVWPLSSFIRAMGGFFIRRNSRNALYRRVLARYVQMATDDGVTQAMFPEGGLSLDGRVGPPRMGLISYILQGFAPGDRDVVFVPVGLAYDRVPEDRILTAAAAEGSRRFRARPFRVLLATCGLLWRRLRGQKASFGTAAAGFGAPLSLRAWLAATPDRGPEALGAELMSRIRSAVPVAPVPLVALALAEGPLPRDALPARTDALTARLQAAGAPLALPPEGAAAAGLPPLLSRGLVADTPEGLQAAPGMAPLLAFQAAALRQLLEDAAAPQT
jgi:glycerol-3-phosphate O-acyltransferase